MSEDWFDRTYRSDETPPADVDARILRRARRATRRWAGSLVVGGVFTIAVALVLGIVLTNVELDIPPTERSVPDDPEPATSGVGDCARTVSLVGPLGGPGRQDRAEICLASDELRAELTWDGEPSCPSRFSVAASLDTPVWLEKGALVIGSARYRCLGGEWTREGKR